MLGPSWKHHFSLKQFRPLHERPVTFIVSQWQHDKSSPSKYYCLYRVSTLITFFVTWIFTYTKETAEGRPRWPIYLTNWGFTLCTIQAFLCSIMVCVSLLGEKLGRIRWREEVLKIYPIYWAVNIIAIPVAFTISIIYWTLIFGAEGAAFTAMNFMVHGLNSILMLVDLCIVCHPVRILHFIYPLLFSLCYTIFTVIYYAAGGTTKTGSPYIYPILKWDQPGKTTGICVGVMILMIFLHLMVFGIYKLRVKIYDVLFLPKSDLPEKQSNGEPNCYVNKAMATEYV